MALAAALAAGATGTIVGPAAAQGGCLSQAQQRQAIQSGQAVSLSAFYGAIVAATGGGTINDRSPRLCGSPGNYTWIVQVLAGGGQQRTVYINALTGAVTVQ